SLLPDLLWCLFLIAGIEHVRFKPGIIVQPGMRALDALEAPDVVYSHSLLMGVVWGALLAAAYFARRYSAGGAAVIFVAVLSHWCLPQHFGSTGFALIMRPQVDDLLSTVARVEKVCDAKNYCVRLNPLSSAVYPFTPLSTASKTTCECCINSLQPNIGKTPN